MEILSSLWKQMDLNPCRAKSWNLSESVSVRFRGQCLAAVFQGSMYARMCVCTCSHHHCLHCGISKFPGILLSSMPIGVVWMACEQNIWNIFGYSIIWWTHNSAGREFYQLHGCLSIFKYLHCYVCPCCWTTFLLTSVMFFVLQGLTNFKVIIQRFLLKRFTRFLLQIVKTVLHIQAEIFLQSL